MLRVAVIGTHGSGKTTLVESFAAAFPDYGHEAEPYYELLDRGAAFSDPPDFDDYLAQLKFSAAAIAAHAAGRDVIFDRCPLDLLVYAEIAGEKDERAVPSRLVEAAEIAIRTLDLIVFLPLTHPDQIVATPDYPRLRLRVDRRLKEVIRSDEWELFGDGGPRLLELTGTPDRRLDALRRAVGR